MNKRRDKTERIDELIYLYCQKKFTIGMIADKMDISERIIYRYLSYPSVRKRIEEEQDKARVKHKITPEYLVEQYLRIYHDAMDRGNIFEGGWNPDRANANKALTQISKLTGLDIKQVEININDGSDFFLPNIEIDNDDTED